MAKNAETRHIHSANPPPNRVSSVLFAVVLLPNIVSISLENEGVISEAITVTGARARKLLGGLVQLLAWLPAV